MSVFDKPIEGLSQMTPDDLRILKENLDGVVQITCIDGEIIRANIISVSEEEGDIVFDLISTNRPDKYEKLDQQPAYLLRFVHIASVQPG